MFLDEKLVQIELEKNRKQERESWLEETREKILRQEREQKSISEYAEEIRKGIVTIDNKEYRCEKIELLDGHMTTYVFPDDVERIQQEKSVASIAYRTMETGANFMRIHGALAIKDEEEFQRKLKAQLTGSQVLYQPLDTGNIKSGKKRIHYAAGITASSAGGVFILHFYYADKKGFVTGNYTCRLLNRYSYEHLFKAMLQLMCEEAK